MKSMNVACDHMGMVKSYGFFASLNKPKSGMHIAVTIAYTMAVLPIMRLTAIANRAKMMILHPVTHMARRRNSVVFTQYRRNHEYPEAWTKFLLYLENLRCSLLYENMVLSLSPEGLRAVSFSSVPVVPKGNAELSVSAIFAA